MARTSADAAEPAGPVRRTAHHDERFGNVASVSGLRISRRPGPTLRTARPYPGAAWHRQPGAAARPRPRPVRPAPHSAAPQRAAVRLSGGPSRPTVIAGSMATARARPGHMTRDGVRVAHACRRAVDQDWQYGTERPYRCHRARGGRHDAPCPPELVNASPTEPRPDPPPEWEAEGFRDPEPRSMACDATCATHRRARDTRSARCRSPGGPSSPKVVIVSHE
jgi:hypothetical protein